MSKPNPAPRSRPLLSALVFAVGAGSQRLLAFLLLPLLTRAVDPAEYGVLSLVLSISAAASILFTFGMDIAIFRTYFQLEGDRSAQKRYIETIWSFLIVVPFAVAGIAALVLVPLAAGSIVSPLELALGLLAAAALAAGTTVPLALLRAEQRLRDYSAVALSTAFGSSIAVVVLVLIADAGITGWLVAILIGNLVGLGAAMWRVPWHRPRQPEWSRLRTSLRFGAPLIPHVLSHWALALADRLVLAGLVTTASLGIYGLAANFAVVALILVQSLNQSLMPTYARAGARDGQGLGSVVITQMSIVLGLCCALALVAPPVIHLLLDSSYAGAASLVGWLIAGYALLGLYYIPMNMITLVKGRSRGVWIPTLLSAAFNLALILVLVPEHGLEAAAIASAAGYALLVVLIYAYSRRLSARFGVTWRQTGVLVLLVAGAYVGAELTTDAMGGIDLIVRCAWIVALAGALLRLRLVDITALAGSLKRDSEGARVLDATAPGT